MTERSRRRGRPRDDVDRRAAILDAARQLFGERGYPGTSMRAIAAAAGVDAALISHYFGDKAQLLAATLALPVDPVAKIREAVSDGAAGLGERLLTTFLTTWDPHSDVFATLFMTATTRGGPVAEANGSPVAQFAQEVVSAAVREHLSGSDADLRANLVVTQIIGIAWARYLAQLEPVASASIEAVVTTCAPALQRIIDGPVPPEPGA